MSLSKLDTPFFVQFVDNSFRAKGIRTYPAFWSIVGIRDLHLAMLNGLSPLTEDKNIKLAIVHPMENIKTKEFLVDQEGDGKWVSYEPGMEQYGLEKQFVSRFPIEQFDGLFILILSNDLETRLKAKNYADCLEDQRAQTIPIYFYQPAELEHLMPYSVEMQEKDKQFCAAIYEERLQEWVQAKRYYFLLGIEQVSLSLSTCEGYSLFEWLIADQEVEILEFLLEQEPEDDFQAVLKSFRPKFLWEVLCLALQKGCQNFFRLVLDFVPVHHEDEDGKRLLHFCTHNAWAIAPLVAAGVSVNAADWNNQAFLHLVAQAGKISDEHIKLLIEHHANLDIQDKKGCTPLYLALRKEHYDLAKSLLSFGADPSYIPESFYLNCAQQGRKSAFVFFYENAIFKQTVLNTKALFTTALDHFQYPLVAYFLSIFPSETHQNLIQFALEQSKNILAKQSDHKRVALQKELLGFLMTLGFDLNIHKLAEIGDVDLMKRAIERGASINQKDEHNRTALTIAQVERNEDLVQLLKGAGAELPVDPGYLAYIGDIEQFKALYPEWHLEPQDQLALLFLAALNGQTEVFQFLLAQEVQVYIQEETTFLNTLCLIAIKNNQLPIFDIMVQQGLVDIEQPIEIAVKKIAFDEEMLKNDLVLLSSFMQRLSGRQKSIFLSPLACAFYWKKIDFIDYFLKAGCAGFDNSTVGLAPSYFALMKQDEQATAAIVNQYLLEYQSMGAHGYRSSPLFLAIECRQPMSVIQKLFSSEVLEDANFLEHYRKANYALTELMSVRALFDYALEKDSPVLFREIYPQLDIVNAENYSILQEIVHKNCYTIFADFQSDPGFFKSLFRKKNSEGKSTGYFVLSNTDSRFIAYVKIKKDILLQQAIKYKDIQAFMLLLAQNEADEAFLKVAIRQAACEKNTVYLKKILEAFPQKIQTLGFELLTHFSVLNPEQILIILVEKDFQFDPNVMEYLFLTFNESYHAFLNSLGIYLETEVMKDSFLKHNRPLKQELSAYIKQNGLLDFPKMRTIFAEKRNSLTDDAEDNDSLLFEKQPEFDASMQDFMDVVCLDSKPFKHKKEVQGDRLSRGESVSEIEEVLMPWQQRVNALILAVYRATLKYQDCHLGHEDRARGTFGLFTTLRHGETGRKRAFNFYTLIKKSAHDEKGLMQRLELLLTDEKTPFHCHSYVSYLLDELTQLEPWKSMSFTKKNNCYNRQEVISVITGTKERDYCLC